MLGVAIAFTSLGLNRLSPIAQEATATPSLESETVVATVEAVDHVGSTDRIMIVAVVIVLIIIIPILLKREVWSNGKRK